MEEIDKFLPCSTSSDSPTNSATSTSSSFDSFDSYQNSHGNNDFNTISVNEKPFDDILKFDADLVDLDLHEIKNIGEDNFDEKYDYSNHNNNDDKKNNKNCSN